MTRPAQVLRRLAWPLAIVAATALVAALAFVLAREGLRPPARKTAVGIDMAPAARAHRVIGWDALVPADWRAPSLPASSSLATWGDNDPRALALLQSMRAAWDQAPTVAALDGAAVRLTGYVVPLEAGDAGLREFLLVPYHGACIHTPPPPANQVVLVRMAEPMRDVRTMDLVQARGVMHTERRDNGLGTSGYTMQASLLMRLGSRFSAAHPPAAASDIARPSTTNRADSTRSRPR